MKYFIEFGQHSNGKWVVTLKLERDSFDEAKQMMQTISEELPSDSCYVVDDTNVKMFDDNNQPHLYHYITAHHPELSLPSMEKENDTN